jgi:hypothetical protein
MRKIQIMFISMVFSVAGYSQQLTNKKGEVILPEAGDWAVGIDATPFLSFAGNLIGGNGLNTAPEWNFLTSNQTVTGKYFYTDKRVYRGSLRIGYTTETDAKLVNDRNATSPVFPDPNETVKNEYQHSRFNLGLSGGVEWRKGKGRLQGFWGGELGFGVSTENWNFTYGNGLDPNATTPVFIDATADDLGVNNITTDTYGNVARVIDKSNPTTFRFGIRGFIGAEYFFLPKMSVGGEFGWGIALVSASKTIQKTESIEFDGTNYIVGEQTTEEAGNTGFAIDTDNINSLFGPAATLRMTFHF